MKAKITYYRKMLLPGILLFLLGNMDARAQQTIELVWENSLGGSRIDMGMETRINPRGGYISVGNTFSNDGEVMGNHGGFDIWYLEQSDDGTIQRQKTYGGSDNDECNSYWIQPDGGCLLAGQTSSDDDDVTFNHGRYDFWAVKTQKNGTIEWQKTYGGSKDDKMNVSWDNGGDQGGFIFAGYTLSNDGDIKRNQGKSDFWIVKTDSRGNLQWQKTYGGSDIDICNSIIRTEDGGYIMAGVTNSKDGDVTINHGEGDFWVVKIDSRGNLQWQKSYGGSDYEEARVIQSANDGGYLVGGSTYSTNGDVTYNHGESDYWVIKISEKGELQWQKTFGGTKDEEFASFCQDHKGGITLFGFSKSSDGDVTQNFGKYDYWILNINRNREIQWQRSLGGSGNDQGTSVYRGSRNPFEESYILNGYSESTDGDITGHHGDFDYWVVKLLISEETSSKIAAPKNVEEEGVEVYPNPFNDQIQVKSEDLIVKIALHQLSGQLIKEEEVNQKKYRLYTGDLPEGTYILYVTTEKGVTSHTVIK